MDRDGLSAGAFPESVQRYTKFEGKQCTLPMLADVYGLYYNKDLLAKAGIDGAAEDLRRADRRRQEAHPAQLRRHDRGRRLRADLGLLREPAAHYAPQFGAHWTDRRRQVGARQPTRAGRRCSTGRRTWSTGTATTSSSALPGRRRRRVLARRTRSRRGKVAMTIDGEYRTAFIANEHPELNYGTAPMPGRRRPARAVRRRLRHRQHHRHPQGRQEPERGVGARSSTSTTTTHALAKLSNGLKNVPTTTASLQSTGAEGGPATSRRSWTIFTNPHSADERRSPRPGAPTRRRSRSSSPKCQAGKVGRPRGRARRASTSRSTTSSPRHLGAAAPVTRRTQRRSPPERRRADSARRARGGAGASSCC